jgi:hypothetical protein
MLPNVTHCNPLSPGHPMSPTVTHCHPMSPTVTHCYPLLPTVTHCYPMSPNVTHCHPLSPSVALCHPTPPPPPLAPLPLGTSVTSVNLCHHYPVATVTTVTSVTIMNHYEPLWTTVTTMNLCHHRHHGHQSTGTAAQTRCHPSNCVWVSSCVFLATMLVPWEITSITRLGIQLRTTKQGDFVESSLVKRRTP